MQARISWQWPAALAFSVVFIVTGALVWKGTLPPSSLLSLLAWLAPAPWIPKPMDESNVT